MPQTPNDLLSSPEGERLTRDPAALKALLSAPETRQLLTLLQRQNGGALQQAAQQARQGDLTQISAMLQGLSATKDGSDALQRMEQKLHSSKKTD
jgi:DNA-binding GntR family transcriptional regulator